jgi:hypothetical protein
MVNILLPLESSSYAGRFESSTQRQSLTAVPEAVWLFLIIEERGLVVTWCHAPLLLSENLGDYGPLPAPTSNIPATSNIVVLPKAWPPNP